MHQNVCVRVCALLSTLLYDGCECLDVSPGKGLAQHTYSLGLPDLISPA